jgi:hypothetical protein
MRWIVSLIGMLLLGLGIGLPASTPAQTPKDKSPKDKAVGKPKAIPAIPGYKKQSIHGFTLLIHDDVYMNNDNEKWKRKPIDVLEGELATVVRRLPDRTVKVLRNLLIWIEWHDKSDPDIGKFVAKYYGVRGNLAVFALAKGKHPLKANNIEVIDMMALTREHQPGVKLERCVLLHEMAHAVHFQLFGSDNVAIQNAYKIAMDRKLYERVKDVYDRTIERPYLTTTPAEYFAELSCAYLDKLHYFPFDNEQLKKHDPIGYKLMEGTWGTRKTIDAALTVKMNRQAVARLDGARGLASRGKKADAITALKWLIDELPEAKVIPEAKKLLAKLEKPAPKE